MDLNKINIRSSDLEPSRPVKTVQKCVKLQKRETRAKRATIPFPPSHWTIEFGELNISESTKRMFSSKESSIMDPLGGEDDDFAVGSVKDKILQRDEVYSTKSLDFNEIEVDSGNDVSTFTVFLTPPSSPNQNPNPESTGGERDERFYLDDNLAQDDDVFKPRSAKDLKSMLIRDCMWNGYTFGIGETNKIGRVEKFRSLTKTPPLVDCNLRITYVDPSEIWPFSLADQGKAGNASSQGEAKPNGGDCADEDVEVDVVGLDGTQKVPETKQERSTKDPKRCTSEKYEKEASSCLDEKPATPLTPSSSDDEYSCKLRSCVKRRRTSSAETVKENCIDQKQRVSSGDESDQDCELGRATHNVLERKRRNELKQRFQYLRDSIPELTGNDRAPKVAILQKAFSYITYLKAEEKNLMEEARKQRNINGQLLKRLLELQSQSLH